MKKLSMGIFPAFPVPSENLVGMSYRDWLIGQLAAGMMADSEAGDVAETAIAIADQIIAKLDSEATNQAHQKELSDFDC